MNEKLVEIQDGGVGAVGVPTKSMQYEKQVLRMQRKSETISLLMQSATRSLL